MKYLFRPKKL